MFTGKLTWRRFLSLLSQLPATSQTALSVNGYIWGTIEELNAAQIDILAAANYQRGGGKGRRPEPIKRPWQKPVTPEVALQQKQNKEDVLSREEFEQHMFG